MPVYIFADFLIHFICRMMNNNDTTDQMTGSRDALVDVKLYRLMQVGITYLLTLKQIVITQINAGITYLLT